MRLETEQMAYVTGGQADHRQGGARLRSISVRALDGISIAHTAVVEVTNPITVETLLGILASVPQGAALTVEPLTRRGEPHGVRYTAEWTA